MVQKVKPFSEEELDWFIQSVFNTKKRNTSIRDRDTLIYIILRYTGARIGEVLKLNLNQLDFQNSLWVIPAEFSKNGLEQRVFLLPKVKALLEWYIHEYRVLFHDGFLMWPMWKCKSKKADSRYLNPKSWRLQHKIYLEKAGLLEIIGYRKDGKPKYARNTHSIRSSYAIRCYKELVIPGRIGYMEMSKLLRHRDPKSTIHYLNNMGLIEEDIQKRWLPEVFNQL